MSANLLEKLNSLPEEYQEVEYIASSGTQYINTGVNLSSSDTVKCKFEMTSATASLADAIYGAYDNPNFFVLLMRSPTQARVGTSSNQAISTNYELNKIYDTSLTNGTYIENGITYTFTPASTFTQNVSCYVMSRNQSGNTIPVSAKVYSFETVGKFKGIPCYRKADGVIGLYDTVSETFFTNAGTGVFTKGNDVSSGGFDIQENEIVLFKKSLPDAYQEVEYIESTGDQYIQTSISIKDTDRLEFDIMPTHTSSAYEEVLGTDWAGSLATNISFYMWSGLTHYFSSNGATLSSWHIDTLYHIEFLDKLNRIVRNDSVIATLSPSSTGVTSNNLNIFGLESGHRFIGRLYTLTAIDSNDTILHQIVPCYRKADNAIGVYDIVADVFYTNAGSGAFTKGNDVSGLTVQEYEIALFRQNSDAHNLPSQYQEVEYIENNGTEYIDTGCYVNLDSKINIKCSINNTEGEFVYRIFGVRDGTNTNAFICGKSAANDNTLYAQFDTVSPTVIQQYSPTSNEMLNIELSSNGLKINGLVYREYQNPISFTSYSTLPLFAHSTQNGFSISIEPIKIYSCKLYNTDALIRDFVPCYRKSDNVIGLYDIVNDVFYTNAGTGTFLKGNNVNNFEVIKI